MQIYIVNFELPNGGPHLTSIDGSKKWSPTWPALTHVLLHVLLRKIASRRHMGTPMVLILLLIDLQKHWSALLLHITPLLWMKTFYGVLCHN